MADISRSGAIERDAEKAITALKKGAHLLKYGRRGKPKFCPFRVSNDETLLIWYSGKEEKQLKLCHVSRIIPGQRTAIFQRYPRPEKEYQSFSLMYSDRSLDLICKDKDEAEVWFVGLKALISHGAHRKWKHDSKSDRASSDSPHTYTKRVSPLSLYHSGSDAQSKDSGDSVQNPGPFENAPSTGLGKAFSDVIFYTAASKGSIPSDILNNSVNTCLTGDLNGRGSAADGFRVSLSSIVSSSSQGSAHEDFDALGDVFIWGQSTGDGLLGGGTQKSESSWSSKVDSLLPKTLESTVVLDVQNLACGNQHAVLVTKQGEVFSWGEESGGRLGHGVESDVPQPKLVEALSGINIELVACGEYHTCAVTLSGELYTWGDGTHNYGLLGHGSEVSHWIPKKVTGQMEGIHVSSVSCGPWHTAIVTSAGQLFTFGDGTFGALGHGNRTNASIPREVEVLRGSRTVRVACGVWHSAAIVENISGSPNVNNFPSGKLFTWGDGDKGRLGHGDNEPKLVPTCVTSLVEPSFCQVACGNSITVALTTEGKVYTMGSSVYGQLGSPGASGKTPSCVCGKIRNSFVEEIVCGSYHVAVLTSRTDVYTWGKGANGRLGHGDCDDRNSPTLVEALKEKQVKSVICGSNFTAVICLHKWASGSDHSVCSGCRNALGFRRKRHNCYNCGLVFCKACTSKKSVKASLAPNLNKPYRVCDECYAKIKKGIETGHTARPMKHRSASTLPYPYNEENADGKVVGNLSRLTSIDSQVDGRNMKQNRRMEQGASQTSVVLAGSGSHWENLPPSRAAIFSAGASRKVVSASVPVSRMVSRATSPVSRKTSPPAHPATAILTTTSRTSDFTVDDSKQINESSTQEISLLRTQVETLTLKSQNLEIELEKSTEQLKAAKAKAEEEIAQSCAAKELIKSLNTQLQDLADQLSERSRLDGKPTSPVTRNDASHERGPTGSSELESHGHLTNGSKATYNASEWVEQCEPGVYITLVSLPNGGRELKRVRFSRKKFTEKQAEKWWEANRLKVLEKYSGRTIAKPVNGNLPSGSGDRIVIFD